MFRIQCVLVLAALCVGLARSWDIAVTTRNQIEFYTNNTLTYTEKDVPFRDLSALVYDAVHNMLLYADKQNDNASIFSYYIPTKKYQPVVRKTSYANIHGLAVDPVNRILFWTSEGSIYSISLQPDARHDDYGKLFLSTTDIPRAIAVDSCRGYVYWTNTNISRPTIERARFDGSGREVIVDSDMYMPVSLAIDQRAKKIYWADDREGIHYSIESADLDGKNKKRLLFGINQQPNDLTISKDSIFWVDLDYRAVWQLPKDPPMNAQPTKYMEFSNEIPLNVAYNYAIQDQIEGQPECEVMSDLSEHTVPNTSFKIPTDAGLFCVHGVRDGTSTTCKCSPGYTGERCDTSVCHNHCLHGDCSLTPNGEPVCRCNGGYTGARCEVHVCENHCLNHGTCELNEQDQPVCHCMVDYEGSRCEHLKVITTTTEAAIQLPVTEAPAPVCNCSAVNTSVVPEVVPQPKEQHQENVSRSATSDSINEIVEDSVISNCNGWDSVRDPLIMALGILVGVLCLTCVVLITKILQLKRRPRIKKRIIVNKNVTPMTARPDQCEITIENCCNMNICETPCFEPRSTIRPTLLDAKPGKEEKKNLITNMEYPDDPY